MSDSIQRPDNLVLPQFLYGTAWKEDETQRLTELALRQGFRGIDTANQRKHYHEAGVGLGLAAMFETGLVRRDEIFLQTKFTFRPGQDHRLPYEAAAPIASQVEQSFTSSLKHLGVETIDSYVLHGPSQGSGLGPADWAAWGAMEEIHDAGRATFLGVSNVSLDQLQEFCEGGRVPPRFVQNRCYAVRGWDQAIRLFCLDNKIIYQGFSLLTANRQVLGGALVQKLSRRYGRTPSQIVFRFALQMGILPLTGTSDAAHMREDLSVSEFSLTTDEVRELELAAC